ncbi:MAG: DUF1571 domain-containing protein [Planctomycetaceae bacterium]|nr:DUF1571 domain-containing protein [Planctomycetaceae bacterium]
MTRMFRAIEWLLNHERILSGSAAAVAVWLVGAAFVAAQQPASSSPGGVATPRGSVIPQIRKSGPTASALPLAPPMSNVLPSTGLPMSGQPLTAAPQNALPLPSAVPPANPLPFDNNLQRNPSAANVQPLPLPARSTVGARPTTPATPDRTTRQPVQPVAYFGEPPATASPTIPAAQPGEHPLAPAIARAHSSMESIAKIQDYSATMVKRERIDGVLGDHQYLFVKVRHQPFSVYIYFLAPADLKGQESIYIEGKNDGNLLAHPNGLKARLIGTVSLNPTGMLAMSGNRYPITEMGVKRMVERLLEVGTNDMKYGECAMKILPGAKINGRDCTCYEVNHPHPRKEFSFHIARIYLDTELNVPIRYESYDWPTEKGGEPILVEEYTYLNLKLNNGFTDLDFDVNNPKYQFK